MASNTLNKLINKFETDGQLIRVKSYVNPEYEITEITDRISKQHNSKALLFENTGTDFPVITNLFGSHERFSEIFRVSKYGELSDRIHQFITDIRSPKKTLKDKIKILSYLKEISSFAPKMKKGRGMCQQVITKKPDLHKLPVLKCWPKDGGPFITLPVVHTKDPETNIRNVGMYRMQVISENKTGMHWHIHKGGANHFKKYIQKNKKMPVAVALGGDPLYSYVASAPLPDNVDEYLLSGFIRKKPVRMVKCITQDIEVPSDADIILEGYIDPFDELFLEGPFGDHTGYYSKPDYYPVLHVTCITHKKNAVYPATVVGIPPQEDKWLIKATEKIFSPVIKNTILPEIKDLHVPEAGVGHNITIVSIQKEYPGHAEKVMHALWGSGQMILNKILIILNDQCKTDDYMNIIRLIATKASPKKHFHFSNGPLDVLDHAGKEKTYGGKLCIDLTDLSLENNENIDLSHFNSGNIIKDLNEIHEIEELYIKKNIPLTILYLKQSVNPEKIIKKLNNKEIQSPLNIYIIADEITQNFNEYHKIWHFACNYDPCLDTYFLNNDKIAINCTTKKRNDPSPEIALSNTETIQEINDKWKQLDLGDFLPSPSAPFIELVNKKT